MKIKIDLKFIFRSAIAFLSLLGVIFLLVAEGVESQNLKGFPIALTFSLLALVSVIASAILSWVEGLKPLVKTILCAALEIFAIASLFVTLSYLISGSVDGIAALTTWDSYNTYLRTHITWNIVSAVFFLLSSIGIIISGFFDDKKNWISVCQ